jgi:acyl-CoA thioesterase I
MRLASTSPPRHKFAMLKLRSFLSLLGFAGVAMTVRAEILVKEGEKVAFLGDSITQAGWGNPNGYVKLVVSGLAANGIKIDPVPAGISGHKSNQMLERLDRDVLSKKPQWMTLSCGVNDVWHGANGVPLDEASANARPVNPAKDGEPPKGTFKENIIALVDKATAAGVKVVILTATVIHEKLDNEENARLAGYNDFLRGVAKEKNLRLADVNAMFQARIKEVNQPDKKVLTRDGVHMNPEGDRVLALGVLQAFGLNEAELKKAQEAWGPVPAN